MGPRPNALPTGVDDITGDVTDPTTVISLGIGVKSRFGNTAGAVLYTSDAGIDVTGDYAGQEENTSAINYGQIISGLLSLAPGGNFVTKQYTFFTPFSRSLIALVAGFFDETYITKPATSRPGNSEIYLVGKGFKGLSMELTEALTERSELFQTLGVNPTTLGSLVTPEILAVIDPVLYTIAEEFFMNIQIKFIEEYLEVFNNYMDNMAELEANVSKSVAEAEETWLRENVVIPIKPEQSLTWYLHNKGKGYKQTGSRQTGSRQTSGMQSGGMQTSGVQSGGGYNDGDDTPTDENNYPGALQESENTIPVGFLPGNQLVGDDAGRNYAGALNALPLMEQTNEGGVNARIWNQAPGNAVGGGLVGANVVDANVVDPDASLLDYKEITVETEKQDDNSSNEGKKTINIT
jgi:hypothetical protein